MSNINNITEQLAEVFLKVKSKFDDLSPVMELITGLIQDAIDRNIDEGGRTDGAEWPNITIFSGGSKPWAELAESTINSYGKSKRGVTPLLKRSGVLMRQIEVTSDGKSINIAANTPYAQIHQYGGWAGRNNEVFIPARPYIVLTEDDVQEIIDILSNYAVQ